jgi:hypothetical protein
MYVNDQQSASKTKKHREYTKQIYPLLYYRY